MGYFQAKYDSRAVIYYHRAFTRLTTKLPSQVEHLFNPDRIRFEALLGQRLASLFCEERFYHFQDLIFSFQEERSCPCIWSAIQICSGHELFRIFFSLSRVGTVGRVFASFISLKQIQKFRTMENSIPGLDTNLQKLKILVVKI